MERIQKIKKTFFFALLMLLLLLKFVLAFAQNSSIQQQFDTANELYYKGDYQTAITSYEKLSVAHGVSAALLFNLGNAYAQQDNPGKAILNYIRARNISPGDAEIAKKLHDIRKKHHLLEEEVPYYSLGTFAVWGWVLLISLVVLAVFLLLQLSGKLERFSKKKNNAFFPYLYSMGVFFVSLISLLSLTILALQWENLRPAVVVAKNVKLRLSPIEDSDIIEKLSAGQLLYPMKQHSNYLYMREIDGRTGWVAVDEVELVENL